MHDVVLHDLAHYTTVKHVLKKSCKYSRADFRDKPIVPHVCLYILPLLQRPLSVYWLNSRVVCVNVLKNINAITGTDYDVPFKLINGRLNRNRNGIKRSSYNLIPSSQPYVKNTDIPRIELNIKHILYAMQIAPRRDKHDI